MIHDVMAAFELFQPESTADAVALLDQYSPNALVMAGGMDSFDWLKDRIKRPSVVIDLSRVGELRGIKERDGGLGSGLPRRSPRSCGVPRCAGSSRSWRGRRARRLAADSQPGDARGQRVAGYALLSTTGQDGAATGPAATSAMRTRPRPSIESTPSSTPIAVWR